MSAAAAALRRVTSTVVLRWLLFVAIFSLAAVPPLDPDLWWHLANGRLILSSGSIPQVDVYSFSAAGQPWVMHEWLADLAMYLLYQHGGLPLLVVIFASAVTAAAACLYLLMRQTGLAPTAAAALTLVGVLAGSTAWGARPQLLNALCCGLLLLGLTRYRAGRLHAVMLPPFIWLWANLHSGFLVGVIISLLFVFGEAFDAWRSRPGAMPRRRLTALAWGIAGGAALSVVNPFGFQTILFPLGTMTSPLIQNNIQEWASPDFHSMAGLMFEGILFLLLVGLATRRVKGRTSEWLLAFALLYLALASQRHVPLFVLGAAPLMGRCAQALLGLAAAMLPPVDHRPAAQAALRWAPARPAAPGLVLGAINLALLIVVAVGMVAYRALPNLQPGREAAAISAVLPVQATDALQALGGPLRVFNYYDYGGYLVWRLFPSGGRVFIDGRVEVYGSQVFSRYLQVSYLADSWPAVIAQAYPDAVILPSAHPLVGILRRDPAWQVLSRDSVATVFTRVGFAP
ncbi:MAG TPA: hypothetical protein VGR77_12110 [Candidatus Dormibacteraeota bacterium]|nr:hypothetical protein [Candidatus Dormibacteraeota bacterium]